jgi:TrpR family trp operon transcriptional repressor
MDGGWQKDLIHLLASARTEAELAELLKSLLTPSEWEELVKRWQIVKRLIEGAPQRDVRDDLEVSIATVTRGSRELQYGSGILQKFYRRLHS